MSYIDNDVHGIYENIEHKGPGPRLMGANTLIGNDVYNLQDEELGNIEEIMLDTETGEVSYAVLSFGGFIGIGDKLFAVPWSALDLDPANKRFLLDVEKERLKFAPGFDKNDWPDMADPSWQDSVHSYYGSDRRYSE